MPGKLESKRDLILTHIKLMGSDPSQEFLHEIDLPISTQDFKKFLIHHSNFNSAKLKFIELGGEKGFLEEEDFKSPTQKIMFRNIAAGNQMMFKEFKSLIQ